MGWLWPEGHSLLIPLLDNNHEWCLSSENCKVFPKVLARVMPTSTEFTLIADPHLWQKNPARPEDSMFMTQPAYQHDQKLIGTWKGLFLFH